MDENTVAQLPASPPRLASRLRERLPEILIEAFFLLVAVVLAFAVDEWREQQELEGRALEARSAIIAELKSNREELQEARDELDAALAQLDRAHSDTAPVEPEAGERRALSVNLSLALLSSAAWRTAQSTEASRRMEYEWLLSVSRVYELQAMYLDAQWAAVMRLSSLAPSGKRTPADVARTLHGRVKLASTLCDGLLATYDELLGADATAKSAPAG